MSSVRLEINFMYGADQFEASEI